MKKIKKFLSLSNLIASKPNIAEIDGLSPFTSLIGGVFGNINEKAPKTEDAIAAIKNVFFKAPSLAKASHLNR